MRQKSLFGRQFERFEGMWYIHFQGFAKMQGVKQRQITLPYAYERNLRR